MSPASPPAFSRVMVRSFTACCTRWAASSTFTWDLVDLGLPPDSLEAYVSWQERRGGEWRKSPPHTSWSTHNTHIHSTVLQSLAQFLLFRSHPHLTWISLHVLLYHSHTHTHNTHTHTHTHTHTQAYRHRTCRVDSASVFVSSSRLACSCELVVFEAAPMAAPARLGNRLAMAVTW